MQPYEAYHTNDIGISKYTDISNRTHIVRHCILANDESEEKKEKLCDALAEIFTSVSKRVKA